MSNKDIKIGQLIGLSKQCDAFFKTELDKAIQKQGAELSDLASFYLLSILLLGLRVDPHFNPETIIQRYAAAFSGTGPKTFRDIGDTSLMMAGIWWESLNRRLVDVDYYIAIGRISYRKEAERNSIMSELFEELDVKFVTATDVLMEATECITAGKKDVNILRMYELWLRTHNPVIEKRLRELGIDPIDIGTSKQ